MQTSHPLGAHGTSSLDPPAAYDPFARGSLPVGVRTIAARDMSRGRLFPCEIWYPASSHHAGEDLPAGQDSYSVPGSDIPRRQQAARDAEACAGIYPLVIVSHSSGQHRRMATYLCTHLASHGYIVAALDHSELVAPELARRSDETQEQRSARAAGWIAARVPDMQFLLDFMLDPNSWDSSAMPDPNRIGIVGHSFGGWTALAALEVEGRLRAVVALAPGGSTRPRPGILVATLTFDWGRDVPTLYLVAEQDCMIPIDGMRELYERTRSTKRMVILRRADHLHFLDEIEAQHEAARTFPWSGDLAWIGEEMRPISELCSSAQAQTFVRGLTLAHMDATLQGSEAARRFLLTHLESELSARGVEAIVHRP